MNQELEETLKKVRAELRELRGDSGDELGPMTLDEETCRKLEQHAFAEKRVRRKPQQAPDSDLPVMDFSEED